MLISRRAAADGATPLALVGIKAAVGVLSAALAFTLAAMGILSLRVARRVVAPAVREPDTEILGLDTAAQTITLSRTADTRLPGRYGLFTTGTEQYVKLGSVLAEDEASVKRKLLTQISEQSRIDANAAFSGWYYSRPQELHLPYSSELIGAPAGPCPAWVFPASEESSTWVVQIHGRGTTRAECLRAVPVFHAMDMPVLVASYRNDSEGPRSRTGTYSLGATEWRDIDAAIGLARRRGAERIILMGWSMGGAIALQLALGSAHRDAIVGVVLDSPVVDWRVVLEYQAELLRLPRPISGMALAALQSEWAMPLTGAGAPIPFDRLDLVARAHELTKPILILHSDDDGFVPSDASHDLAVARPDLVELQVFEVARHTKLWNYDQVRWTDCIRSWVARQGLMPSDAAAAGS